MIHAASPGDHSFRERFESCLVPPESFDHRAHLRLAYVYLAGYDDNVAARLMRAALVNFIRHQGIDASKYHETLTRAWLLAVRHFMQGTPPTGSADDFIDRNARLLDTGIMLTHYSRELLFSDEARRGFVEPDLSPIPRMSNPPRSSPAS